MRSRYALETKILNTNPYESPQGTQMSRWILSQTQSDVCPSQQLPDSHVILQRGFSVDSDGGNCDQLL